MIVPVMAISNLVLTQQIYSEETNGSHAYNRDGVPLIGGWLQLFMQMCKIFFSLFPGMFFVQKFYICF